MPLPPSLFYTYVCNCNSSYCAHGLFPSSRLKKALFFPFFITLILMPEIDSTDMKKNQKRSFIYSSDFQAMLDGMEEDDCADENGQSSERKRRLSEDQVRKLEKMFEIENKLEADKKQRIAEELGLQPRQVAVWFQNRRARWKTKQLERDYGALQANYDALKLNYSNLETENQTLISELRDLKEKIVDRAEEQPAAMLLSEPNYNNNVAVPWSPGGGGGQSDIQRLMGGLRDGLSDSDCSGESILNSSNILPCTSSSSSSALLWQGFPYLDQQPPWNSCFQMLADSRGPHHHHHQQQQLVKVEEEQIMFGSDHDSVSFFSLDQPPTFY